MAAPACQENAAARNFRNPFIQIGFALSAAAGTAIQTVLVQFATRLTQIKANVKRKDSQAVTNGNVQNVVKLTLTMSVPAGADKQSRKLIGGNFSEKGIIDCYLSSNDSIAGRLFKFKQQFFGICRTYKGK